MPRLRILRLRAKVLPANGYNLVVLPRTCWYERGLRLSDSLTALDRFMSSNTPFSPPKPRPCATQQAQLHGLGGVSGVDGTNRLGRMSVCALLSP
jgi:hypothetical protein